MPSLSVRSPCTRAYLQKREKTKTLGGGRVCVNKYSVKLKLSICKFRWGSRLAGMSFENFNCRLFAGLFDAFLLFNGRFSILECYK